MSEEYTYYILEINDRNTWYLRTCNDNRFHLYNAVAREWSIGAEISSGTRIKLTKITKAEMFQRLL